MKFKNLIYPLFFCTGILFSSCGIDLTEVQRIDGEDTAYLVWEDRTYVPFCVVSKNDCGKKLGYVADDKEGIVFYR